MVERLLLRVVVLNILKAHFRQRGRVRTGMWLVAAIAFAAIPACTPTTTTLRFVTNNEAVAVRNPTAPKAGDRLEALLGTRKKFFFYVTRGGSVRSFHSSIDLVPGKKTLLADLLIDQHSVRVFIIPLRHPLAMVSGPPTPENKSLICREPMIAEILGGAQTEMAGTGRGAWITTVSAPRRLYFRTLDPDLIALIDVDGLDSARAADFVLRIGSLTR
jgi:hypothetical protein